MKRALFISQNLIGDGLNIYPALKSWWNTHQDWSIDLLTYPDHVSVIYEHMKIPLRVIYDASAEGYDFSFSFDTNVAFRIGHENKVHIAKAYAIMLGVDIAPEDYRLVFDPPEEELTDREKGLVIVSPFSKSCSSNQGYPPNKMLPWGKWLPIIRFLRTLGPVGVIGSRTDRASGILEIPEDEYFTGLPLTRVAHILRRSKCVVTIDNGIAHMAASQLAKMVLFYPACLGTHWIIPLAPKDRLLQVIRMDPVSVDIVQLTLAVKHQLTTKL